MEIPLEECSGVSKCGKPVLQRCLPGCRWWKAAHSRVQKWLLLECGLTPFSHNIKGKSRHSVQHAQHLICTSPLNCCSPNDSPLEHEKKNVEFIEGNANRRQEHSQQESARQWEYTTFFFHAVLEKAMQVEKTCHSSVFITDVQCCFGELNFLRNRSCCTFI